MISVSKSCLSHGALVAGHSCIKEKPQHLIKRTFGNDSNRKTSRTGASYQVSKPTPENICAGLSDGIEWKHSQHNHTLSSPRTWELKSNRHGIKVSPPRHDGAKCSL